MRARAERSPRHYNLHHSTNRRESVWSWNPTTLRDYALRRPVVSLFSSPGRVSLLERRITLDNRFHPSTKLKQQLWQLCYPDEAYDASSSIGDLYGAAMRQKKADLGILLQSRLTVCPDSLPEYYLALFNFPWFRCYTLNVDDLESAVGRRFNLQRPPITISARGGEAERLPGLPPSSQGLEVVHLNGVVPSPPEDLTFSETQYAERIGNQEPWYSRCVVDRWQQV